MTRVDPNNEASYCVCVIPSRLDQTRIAKDAILLEVERNGFPEDAIFGLKLALEEALTNAVKHGNASDPSKPVTVRYAVTPQQAVVIVRDEGTGFNPDAVPDCTRPERVCVPSGRGIMLMKAYMDEVCYRDQGREVRFVKRCRPVRK